MIKLNTSGFAYTKNLFILYFVLYYIICFKFDKTLNIWIKNDFDSIINLENVVITHFTYLNNNNIKNLKIDF